MKYNKNIKKRINININNYKEYSEIYSTIEIEIKPVNNKYTKFINTNKENEKYIHIYFDNNKREIKRKFLNQMSKLKQFGQLQIIKLNHSKNYFMIVNVQNIYILKNYIEIILIIWDVCSGDVLH